MKIVAVVIYLLLSACALPTNPSLIESQQAAASKGMVVTANPHATKAGAEILRAGGSAVDAAIAIQAVLTLVEPQSSGLGGGGFMTYFDGTTKQVSVYDGRETAPALATPDLFINSDGEPYGFIDAKTSGISTGVPGMVSLLELAHSDHGRLAWGEHFHHAKSLASDGFAISPRLQSSIERIARSIPTSIEEGPLHAYNYFFDSDGQPHAVGHILRNPNYINTLDLIAQNPRNFYEGSLANEIVEQVNMTPRASTMQATDLQVYSARREQALCVPYRDKTLCGPPPPSSWLAVATIMSTMERMPMPSSAGANDSDNWVLFAEAQRIAYADRDHYVADPDFVDVPVAGLLNPDYFDERARLLDQDNLSKDVSAGDPWAYQQSLQSKAPIGIDATYDAAGTSHFVVVDLQGNVVSMTASVESVFGSTRMAGGMFLNNQLTDFSFQSHDENGNLIANSVAPGKRPRSSMSPTIVLDKDGEFLMATGSPGGNSIIAYTAKTLVGVFEWGLSPQASIDLPNLIARSERIQVEQSRASDDLIMGLSNYGYSVDERGGENSGLSIVLRDAQGNLVGGVDPRREGMIELIEADQVLR